jgi:phage host-nuclease inhibitor protein Gam
LAAALLEAFTRAFVQLGTGNSEPATCLNAEDRLKSILHIINQPPESMNKLIQLKTPSIKTRDEMEMLVREIAHLKLNEKLLLSGMDAELQSVRDNYESRLGTLAQLLVEKVEAARAWAKANPAKFGERRSIEFAHGKIGFRTGPPKLKTVLKRKWDDVLDSLRARRWGHTYIRVKEEINKEQLIADIGARILSAAELRKIGAQVVQEDSFYVEPALAKVDEREVAAVA